MKDFLKGLASIFNIAGEPNDIKFIKNDADAIAADWEAVGQDLKSILFNINEITNEITNENFF